jgi:hypothetical protein
LELKKITPAVIAEAAATPSEISAINALRRPSS